MIKCWNLASGSRLVVEEIPYVKSVAVGIYIQLGSRHEPDHMKGVSHFIEHMLFKGTETRTARDIAESFERIGGQLNAYTSKEHTCVYTRTLDEHLPIALDILFDMLFRSRFILRDFENEKNVIIEEIHMYEDTPDDLIHDVFSRSLWRQHPMGSPILGTEESVSSFDLQQVQDFYNQCYTPANMVIAVAGNVNAEAVRDQIASFVDQHANSSLVLPYASPGAYQAFRQLVEKQTEQVQICLGVPGINYFDQRRFTQNVMNNILGGGMSSRLFQALREELGLAYSIYSYPANYSDTGAYSIYIGTGPGRISVCFEALRREVIRFTEEGISEVELERTRELIKSSMYMGLENVMNRMTRLGKSLLMYKEVISPEEVIKRIYAVTPQMVSDLAFDLLARQRFSVASIAPVETLREVEREYQKWWE